VRALYRDPVAAKAQYGPIASWNTSGVTDMHELFRDKEDFNEDISRWDVSNVVDMTSTFCFATSFNCDTLGWDVRQVESMAGTFANTTSFDRQLNGAWSTSTASKTYMFYKSPGTIAGKAIDVRGTIA